MNNKLTIKKNLLNKLENPRLLNTARTYEILEHKFKFIESYNNDDEDQSINDNSLFRFLCIDTDIYYTIAIRDFMDMTVLKDLDDKDAEGNPKGCHMMEYVMKSVKEGDTEVELPAEFTVVDVDAKRINDTTIFPAFMYEMYDADNYSGNPLLFPPYEFVGTLIKEQFANAPVFKNIYITID